MNFGQRVRYNRRLREWSQEELAQLAGLTPNTVGHIERRGESSRVTLASAVKLAEAFGCSLNDLVEPWAKPLNHPYIV